MRTRFPVVLVLAVVVCLPAPLAAAAPKPVKVRVGNNFFNPEEVQIRKGGTLKFKWAGGVPHNVTSDDGPGKAFASKTTSEAGVNFTHAFRKSGLYSLHCTIHPDQMKLAVRVR